MPLKEIPLAVSYTPNTNSMNRWLFICLCCTITLLTSCGGDSNTSEGEQNPLVADWYLKEAYAGGRQTRSEPTQLKDVSFLSLYADGTYESRGFIFDISRGMWTEGPGPSTITIDQQDTPSGERMFNYRLMEDGNLELSMLTDQQLSATRMIMSTEKPAILRN